MAVQATNQTDEEQVQKLLEQWAYTTRMAQRDQVLTKHASDVVIFDVLPPLKYEGADYLPKKLG